MVGAHNVVMNFGRSKIRQEARRDKEIINTPADIAFAAVGPM